MENEPLEDRYFLGALFAVGFIIFGRTIPYDFVYDDFWMIVRNPAVLTLAKPLRFFLNPLTSAMPGSGLNQDIYRPIVTFSYALNHAVTGFVPAGFRIPNLILHFCNVSLLFLLLRRYFQPLSAFLGAALFLLHPVQVESVVWIAQRSTLLASAGLLAAAWFWESSEHKPLYSWLAGAAFLIAMFSKEAALPFLLLLIFHPLTRRADHRGPFAALVMVAVFYVGLRVALLGRIGQGIGFSTSFPASLIDGLGAFGVLMKSLFWPTELNISYPWPGNREILAGGACLVVVGILALVSYRRERRVFVGTMVFLAFFLPVAGFVPMVKYAADRFLYLPLVGAAIVVAAASVRSRAPIIMAAILMVLLAVAVRRTNDWRNSVTLWSSSVQVDAANPFAQASLAEALRDAGDLAGAEDHYKLALAQRPTRALARGVLESLMDLSRRRNDLSSEKFWEQKLKTTM